MIFGIDIVKGSLRGRIRPEYALVVLDNDKEEEYRVTRSKLFRMVRELKPDIVAFDSIQELFSSKRELVDFLKVLPSSIKFVQIAGKESLHAIARRYGIRMNIRSPADEARACAYLASFGVGSEISVFFDKTIITVSRNRSLGKGGWHQNRYRRRVHDEVRMIFNEIKEILKNKGFEFSEDVRFGYGGISRGTLLVNAERSEVPINSFKTKNVQVRVEAIERDKIEYIPLKKRVRHLIVGIDPGSTVGVAVLDLDGKVLGVRSKKGWSFSEVIEYILSFGKPVIVATDKSNAPEYVSKVRSAFNAIIYTPRDDMSVERKIQLTRGYKVFNDHERDALSSAIEAFNSYKNKLMNIEKRMPAGYDLDAVKAGVIKGIPLKTILGEERREEKKEKKTVPSKVDREEIKRKDRLIEELYEENRILKEEIKELRREIESLKQRIVSISREEHERIRRDNYIKTLEAENKRLRMELSEKNSKIDELESKLAVIKRMRYLELFEGWKWVKVLKKFTKEEIERVEKEFGINENDIIFIHDCSGGGKTTAEYLIKKGVKAIISSSPMSHLASSLFEEAGIPVIDVENVEVEIADEIVLLNSKKFEERYLEEKRKMEKRKLDLLEELIQEYRLKRKNI
ncbi:hypothetical protein Asulf_01548 [Archaeoglobus sulfaticallidus PM70-1]|uniref:DUF460 domain-containing protein n=1 Tax=Archaeoglobus sulfaticallidus PM70-1 TaxID=387631 RepID=N0BMQ4_9EURY|nr:DUF460 domain-containing protein [Archaeoglobus sulfaticallidus]AGK61525.1 hypothetical protein Asulf_01548 [Archaeoglobus sulfaticallidus PM70-1]